MRNIKIVADSSADILEMDGVAFASAPLKIIAGEKEFVDDRSLDVSQMVSWFETYKGKSKTSCPNSSDWLEAFGDAEEIFCVTITSGLSGSYNSACIAKQMYEEAHPGRRVRVIDSLSAGPELTLIIEKLADCIGNDMSYEDICEAIDEYQKKTGLLFMLESLKSLAANGRVSPAVAKIAGVLGIRVVGKASDEGTLQQMHKCRGEAKSLSILVGCLRELGLKCGKVRIAHCVNLNAANALKNMIIDAFPRAEVNIHGCRGLCSYYAEKGGMLIGFEKM
jgi:DegV family protein with EDD domain